MVEIHGEKPRYQAGRGAAAGVSRRGGSGRWVHMWSRNAVAIYNTHSTAAMAKDCIARELRGRDAEQRWKNYLALLSQASAVASCK